MMVKKDIQIQLADLITSLSDVIDLVNPELVNHHQMVAYAAYNIAGHMGLPAKQRNELVLAGKLHDIGALACKERKKTMTMHKIYRKGAGKCRLHGTTT